MHPEGTERLEPPSKRLTIHIDKSRILIQFCTVLNQITRATRT